MDINIGKSYENKTWKYLVPVLRGHGQAFVRKFNRVFKLASGIHDTLLGGSDLAEERVIYFMIDKKYQPYAYEDFIKFIRTQEYYAGDYCPDANFLTTRRHMVVLRVPEDFYRAYDYFLKGEYSKMYSEEQAKVLFLDSGKHIEYGVLTKSEESLKPFLEVIDKEFKVKTKPADFRDAERDLPLRKKEEIFNYRGDKVFFRYDCKKVWQEEE